MMKALKNEPVMVAWVAGQIVNYAGRYGLDLPASAVADALGLLMLALAWFVRSKVTPTAKIAPSA